MNDTVRIVHLIETKLTRRGDGKSDPLRVVTQYWTFDGELVCEVDLLAGCTEDIRK